jgi:glutamyl-tRNA synthetase
MSVGLAISRQTKGLIRKLAVKNAFDYGSARENPILAKVLSREPGLKAEMKSLRTEIERIVAEVNALPRPDLEREYGSHAAEFESEQEEKAERSARHNFSVEGAEVGKFVTRFPPEPGGYMHIGHSKPLFIEDALRQAYDGKLMLYFDDTNPDNERQEFVDAFKRDLEWLGVAFDGEYYASDSIPLLYGHAGSMIKKGMAYVCTCSSEKIKEGRAEGKGCEHKEQDPGQNLKLWSEMLGEEHGDGGAVLRLNSNMSALNTVMRDPTLFRTKRARHYRQGDKYHVWPTYDFCTPVIDSIRGITDVLRSKEYELRDELYFAVLGALGLRKPRITSFSRLEIANNITSKRKIRQMIADKLVQGYSDPRLVTISALRRRGITANAIREFALSFGMGKSESVADLAALLNLNKKIIEPIAKHLSFIDDPVPVHVANAEGIELSLRLNPYQDIGYRRYMLNGHFFINASDSKRLKKGDTVRFKDAFSVAVISVGDGVEAECVGSGSGNMVVVPWIAESGAVRCELLHIGNLMEGERFNDRSITRTHGYAEGYASSLVGGEVVKFERKGFFRLDGKADMSFISV